MPFGRPLDGRKPAGGVTVFPLSDELMIAETGVVDRLLLVEGRVGAEDTIAQNLQYS